MFGLGNRYRLYRLYRLDVANRASTRMTNPIRLGISQDSLPYYPPRVYSPRVHSSFLVRDINLGLFRGGGYSSIDRMSTFSDGER